MAFQTAYIADIVFFALLIVLMLVDGRKGFIGVFFSFVSTILAVIIALLFAARLQTGTNGLFGLEGLLSEKIGGWLSGIAPFNVDISSQGIEAQIAALPLPEFLKASVLAEITALTPDVAAGTLLGEYVGMEISQYLTLLLCGIVLFFLVKLLVRILKGLLNRLAESCFLLRKINRLGGVLVGALKGLALTCVILAIVALIPNEGLHTFFNQTMVLRAFYNSNPIHLIFSAFIS